MTEVPVSERALMARVNRKLRDNDEVLRHAAELSRAWSNLGSYYTVNVRINGVTRSHIDIEELARELGCLKPYERVSA